MNFHQAEGSDFFVPDGVDPAGALGRATHLGIGAHQDDLEFFAIHGILECFGRDDQWFAGVTVTDGAGGARMGRGEGLTGGDVAAVRRREQRKAAVVGEYAAMAQLGYTSAEVRDPGNSDPVDDLEFILRAARPHTVYLHNPADKHDTHIAVLAKSLAALRRLPADSRPARVLGCEIWRDLDWLPDALKVVLPVSGRASLQSALIGVFDSQIRGGKRYDLAVMGRRLAHATFHDSHAADAETGLVFAVDLGPLLEDAPPSLEAFTLGLVEHLASDIRARIARVAG